MEIPILRIPFTEEDREFIHRGLDEILDSGYLTMGRFTRQFEQQFSEFTGAAYAVAVSNGTAALEVTLHALGIEGQSVIVPTNTFLATAFAVIHSGNRVIFVDSDPGTLCLDVGDVRRRIDADTKAVILVHIGGVITPAYEGLKQLCDSHNLYLIEDCAHAHGSSIDGKPAGTLGVAGAFVVYYALYRDTRFRDFVEDPVHNWKILAVDFVLYLACAGLVTALFVEPCNARGAFFAGCGWQGLIGGAVSGADLKTLRNYTRRRKGE